MACGNVAGNCRFRTHLDASGIVPASGQGRCVIAPTTDDTDYGKWARVLVPAFAAALASGLVLEPAGTIGSPRPWMASK